MNLNTYLVKLYNKNKEAERLKSEPVAEVAEVTEVAEVAEVSATENKPEEEVVSENKPEIRNFVPKYAMLFGDKKGDVPEEVKPEEVKPEEVKPEEVKPEVKPEEVKPEVKPEEVKPE